MKRSVRLLLSALCGACACGLAFLALSSARREADEARGQALASFGGTAVTVCVATEPLEAGDTVDATCAEEREWVAELLPAGACASLSEVEGRAVTERVPAGAVLADIYFTRERGEVEIPRDCAAVSVPLQQEYALGGALDEGEKVDVYVTRDGISDCVAASARVIDASTFGTDGSGSLEWATLAVEPEAVGELLSASARGTVSLVVAGEGAADGARDGADGEAQGGRDAGAGGAKGSAAGAGDADAEAPAEGTEAGR